MNLKQLSQEELLEKYALGERDFSEFNISLLPYKSNLTKALFYEANLNNSNLNLACLDKLIDHKTNYSNAINVPEYFLRSKIETPLTKALDEVFDCHYKNNPDIILCLQPGLTREEIDELLIDIPYTIPEEIYQLYGWRNGMSGKGIQNYGYLSFAKARGFLPLEKVVKDYKYSSRYLKKALVLFPPANDNSAAYAVDLGDERKAPVRNFDTEHKNSFDAFIRKYERYFHMMCSCNSSKYK
jgi:hypothetical protein